MGSILRDNQGSIPLLLPCTGQDNLDGSLASDVFAKGLHQSISVQALAKAADESARKAIIDALRDLSYSIEAPDDSVTRLWGMHVHLSAVRAGIDLNLFNTLVDSDVPLSVEKLAGITGADKILLARICRELASLGNIKETGRDEFGATGLTKTLADSGHQGTIKHYFDTCGPVYQELPAFLKKTGYKDITDANNTVFQDAWKTKQNCFEWIMTRPASFENLNRYMASRRQNQPSWIDFYPLKEDDTGVSPERAIFVDIGGGIGHQCADFKGKYAYLPGKVILEDLPFAIDHAIPTPGVDNMAVDFFKEQPIKGAKFYYLRAVLHDWPDSKAKVILQNTKAAMAPDSFILIDEIVSPNQGVNWQICQIDLTMMASGAAMERTEAQWAELFDSVGLKIHKRLTYTPGMSETVTAVVLK